MHGNFERQRSTSIYSRSICSTVPTRHLPAQPIQNRSRNSPIGVPACPELAPIDHVIGQFGGSTMALELLPSRVQATKSYTHLSPQEHCRQLQHELVQYEQENNYFRSCYDSYQKLRSSVVEACNDLTLHAYFEPESIPAQDPFLYDVIRRLNTAIAASRICETEAEIAWKRYWNIPQATEIPVKRI